VQWVGAGEDAAGVWECGRRYSGWVPVESWGLVLTLAPAIVECGIDF
jgi:hypothetical protein